VTATLSFSANYADLNDEPAISLKIGSDSFELNVTLRIFELARLDEVLSTRWEGGALRLGSSASSATWWSCDEGKVAICVGHDDQTWDFSISFPVAEFENLRESIESELASSQQG
jgi:hypothetical protein